MAVISPAEDALVVRVVYDGPPLAGKTTSLRTLAAKLGRELHTPAEIDGRTLFFDWLDYTGGIFEGRRIRCQIVTVPGQNHLASRRRTLLQSADVVVFVSDTTREALPQARLSLQATRGILGAISGPPVGIVLQANKRDHKDAVPLNELRTALDAHDEHLAIVESIATDGDGIREAFVYAVRLALERVSEISKCAPLETMRPVIDNPAELLEELLRSDAGAPDSSTPADWTVPPPPAEPEPPLDLASDMDAPRIDGSVALVWPAAAGRALWEEATLRSPVLHRQASGDWYGTSTAWRIHSPTAACFPDRPAADRALQEWANLHEAHRDLLVGRRCLVLIDTGDGHHRLWQCLSTPPTLRSQLEQASGLDAASLLKVLTGAARALVRACAQWKDISVLPAHLDTITATPNGPRYAAPMPYPGTAANTHIEDLSAYLRTEFAFLSEQLIAQRDALLKAVAERAQRQPTSRPDAAAALLGLLLRN